MRSSSPIGIFDSGIGGLTVARAVKDLLPDEQLIYFGDTAHLPYGEKSVAAIQAYSVRIADFLIQRGCKLILIACNSASAAAYDLVKEYAGKKAQVFNVIDPVVDYVRETYADASIGLIGTKATVQSGVYQQKIESMDNKNQCKAQATPLLVPMIEEGFLHNRISHDIIEQYLSSSALSDISALILGCTHYPLIKKEVEAYYNGKVQVIDSSVTVARALKGFLELHNLKAASRSHENQFFVSDYTASFEGTTRLFFGESVSLEKFDLWE
ncbi:MAG: glutamate racemase [Imperialibacter sp.]|uniref:glutamate racemase n=1 Tax=Imperialibacter sp. TaxID=2038411 RepID=UPI003A8722DC